MGPLITRGTSQTRRKFTIIAVHIYLASITLYQHFSTACFLQKSPQVALNPQRLPSRVVALHRSASVRVARTFFGATTCSCGFGTSFVRRVLWRAPWSARARSLDRSIVSAIFSGSGCPDLNAASNILCHIGPPFPSGDWSGGRTARGAGGGRTREAPSETLSHV